MQSSAQTVELKELSPEEADALREEAEHFLRQRTKSDGPLRRNVTKSCPYCNRMSGSKWGRVFSHVLEMHPSFVTEYIQRHVLPATEPEPSAA